MGNFLAVTAVRDLSAQAVAQAIADYARRYGLDSSVLNRLRGMASSAPSDSGCEQSRRAVQ
jgi:hypothetical protein